MSLFFLQPIYLYGLIAAGLPVLIHLLNRRRLKRIRFPAVRFVLLSQRRISRSYRLRHWLLLALRTLAVILLVLLLANPIFQTGVGLFAGGGPVAMVAIVDNSLSVKWSLEGQGFERSKEAVQRLVASLKDGDRAAIIPTNRQEGMPIRLKGEREVLLRELEGIQLADGSADFAAALTQAYELLKEPAAQKEIWLFTDLALTGWDRFTLSALPQYDPLVPFKLIKVRGNDPSLNATLKEIRLRSQGAGAGLPIHVEAVVINFTDQEIKELLVELSLDDQGREKKVVSVPPRAEMAVSFVTRVDQPGSHHGKVTLKKEGMVGNSTGYFTLQVQDKLKILVVDGDPQTSLVQSETFFLTRALNPSGERDSSLLLPTVVIPEGLSSVSLESYAAVILCNVASIPDALLPRLNEYLRRGGGVLVFAGERLQPENYNLKLFQSSPSLLPAQIREKKVVAESAGVKIARIDTTHPALQPFAEPILQESLKSAKVWGYFRTDLPAKAALISLSNGDPLLFEKKLGPGSALFFTTAADRDWTDLPLKTAYLPLIQALSTYLAGAQRGTMDAGIPVDSPKKFSFPPTFVGKSLRIVKPDGKERETFFAAETEKASATFQENDIAGIYRISQPAIGEGTGGAAPIYAVNAPFLESRLDEIDERGLRLKLNPLPAEVVALETLEKGGTRMDLSLPLIVLLIVTLLGEGWLAQRVS